MAAPNDPQPTNVQVHRSRRARAGRGSGLVRLAKTFKAATEGFRRRFRASCQIGVVHVAFGSCATSVAGPNGGAQLYERWRRALRDRQSGADLKPPQAAVVKSNGGERCGDAGLIPAGTVERGERKQTADEVSKRD